MTDSPSGLRWLAGDEAVHARVRAWLADPDARGRVLRDAGHRVHVRLDATAGGGPPLFLKHFRVGTGAHPVRERAKAMLGRSAAQREWRALVALHAAGAPVPAPLGLARLAHGDFLLVLPFLEGVALDEALDVPRAQRRRLLRAVGEAVHALHEAGFAHGDLHRENVRVTPLGPVLLDLQAARRTPDEAARAFDLGFLDHSLRDRVSAADRLRVRSAALGVRTPFDDAARARIRAAGRASEEKAQLHAANRTRRALRPGPDQPRVRADGLDGLRDASFSEAAVREALASHREALARGDGDVLKHDARSRLTAVAAGGRCVVVKEVLPRRLGRVLADRFRGSPARRAWRAARGLRARGIGVATPLAFLERRRLGFPAASLMLLEDLRPAVPADVAAAHGVPAHAVTDALVTLALALHRRGVEHGDLKSSHVFLDRSARGLAPRLIDLEGVRFRERLSERDRVRALAQLNASLPDDVDAAARRAAFARYARALPFAAGERQGMEQVVRASLARRHRWTGADCALAREASLSASRS